MLPRRRSSRLTRRSTRRPFGHPSHTVDRGARRPHAPVATRRLRIPGRPGRPVEDDGSTPEGAGCRTGSPDSPSRWCARTASCASRPGRRPSTGRRRVAGRHRASRRQGGRPVQLLEGHERDELRRAEVLPSGPRQQQHRQLQPHLTRAERGRSGHGLRCRRRHQLIRRGRAHRPHAALGLERPGGPPDLLPPCPEGDPERHATDRRRPPPHRVGRVGGPVARAGRRDRHRALEHDGPGDHRERPASPRRSSSSRRRTSRTTRPR